MPTADYSNYHQPTGTTSDGSKFDNFVDAVQSTVNGLDNDNIAADAGIDASKIAAPYAAYVPTWAASGTSVSLGNGTISGRWVQVGSLVHFMMKLAPGSSTTYGTGTYTFGLPVAAKTTFVGCPIGNAFANDTSAGNFAQSLPILAGSTTFNIQHPATWPTGVQVVYAQTAPWTWASGDSIFVSGVYEAA